MESIFSTTLEHRFFLICILQKRRNFLSCLYENKFEPLFHGISIEMLTSGSFLKRPISQNDREKKRSKNEGASEVNIFSGKNLGQTASGLDCTSIASVWFSYSQVQSFQKGYYFMFCRFNSKQLALKYQTRKKNTTYALDLSY